MEAAANGSALVLGTPAPGAVRSLGVVSVQVTVTLGVEHRHEGGFVEESSVVHAQ